MLSTDHDLDLLRAMLSADNSAPDGPYCGHPGSGWELNVWSCDEEDCPADGFCDDES